MKQNENMGLFDVMEGDILLRPRNKTPRNKTPSKHNT